VGTNRWAIGLSGDKEVVALRRDGVTGSSHPDRQNLAGRREKLAV